MEQFIEVSVILTGFDQSIIAPEIDPIDIKQTYFDIMKAFPVSGANGKTETADFLLPLLECYVKLKNAGDTPEQIGAALVSDDTPGPMGIPIKIIAGALNYLWYLGIIPVIDSDGNLFSGTTKTAGMNAYTKGLAWSAMQSHPMGYSTLHYASWKDAPMPLSDFTGEQS